MPQQLKRSLRTQASIHFPIIVLYSEWHKSEPPLHSRPNKFSTVSDDYVDPWGWKWPCKGFPLLQRASNGPSALKASNHHHHCHASRRQHSLASAGVSKALQRNRRTDGTEHPRCAVPLCCCHANYVSIAS